MFAAGARNRRVTIQRWDPAAGQDEFFQPVPGWVPVCRPWASIKHPTGLETVRGGAETSVVKASIRINYRSDITAAMQVLHGDKVYRVVAVLPDETGREYVDLVCESNDTAVA